MILKQTENNLEAQIRFSNYAEGKDEEAFTPAALQGKGMIGASLRTIGKNRTHNLNKEFRISDPIQIALILLDLLLNIEILQVTHVMD